MAEVPRTNAVCSRGGHPIEIIRGIPLGFRGRRSAVQRCFKLARGGRPIDTPCATSVRVPWRSFRGLTLFSSASDVKCISWTEIPADIRIGGSQRVPCKEHQRTSDTAENSVSPRKFRPGYGCSATYVRLFRG